MDPYTNLPVPTGWSNWTRSQGSFSQFLGLSTLFSALLSHSYILDSAKLLVLGSIIETGRRLFQWLIERFRIQYSITAQFDEGDPVYEWIVLFLTDQNVWRRSCDFRVEAKNSRRTWGITESKSEGNAEYIPTYELPQLFRWRGYWLEIKRNKSSHYPNKPGPMSPGMATNNATMFITIYTLDMSVLYDLVEGARLRYVEVSKPNVIVHTIDAHHMRPNSPWNNVKRKPRRPLSSIILPHGVIKSLLDDAKDFINTEEWYTEAGIPHRRGYLLYGPPGTGKSSTIYAIAGELGFEIYSLSLSSGFVDDGFLERAVSSMPKHSIFLLEDIDCAFPSREDEEEDPFIPMGFPPMPMRPGNRRSPVTLSGLLIVIDGVGSEEGKLFFATTNYVDRLDAAILRPGRIDKKIEYSLATKEQASQLFLRFFPEKRFKDLTSGYKNGKSDSNTSSLALSSELLLLADKFAAGVPEHEFSTAELQGYLLSCKARPIDAASDVGEWVIQERNERHRRKEREDARKQKMRDEKEKRGQMVTHGYGLATQSASLRQTNGPVDATPSEPGKRSN